MIVTREERLMLIAAAMNGILANSYRTDEYDGRDVAASSIYYADSVIVALRKEDMEGGESNAA